MHRVCLCAFTLTHVQSASSADVSTTDQLVSVVSKLEPDEEKNSTFWCSEIPTSHGNTQRLWQTLQRVLGVGDPVSDDTGAHTLHTADDFAAF